MNKEKLYFDKLEDIFVGLDIKGESGYVNLMSIKRAYFKKIQQELKKEINEKIKNFPNFREELFDKLYSFFKKYFSESGSIYFSYTPLKSKVYEQVYTNDKDVALFWKTNMLYYVKSDKLWNNLSIDFEKDGVKYKIDFDVSGLEHKKSNEKKELVYEVKNVKGKEIVFSVNYSQNGKKTKIPEILKSLKDKKIFLEEDSLIKVFRTFEKQNEVDFFINKNAEKFLKEQFDMYLKNYLFDDESDFSEKRLKELKFLKEIAYKTIDFVSQFEDELVKIWNKPKFVLNSNYVITLDKIASHKEGLKIIEKIIKDKGIKEQEKEWKNLGLGEINSKDILKNKELNKEYEKLPIDTKHFTEEIKYKILGLFDNLDEQLDGWLIHSENYQALNTIKEKFKEKVQTIYIDPPFNLGTNADFLYNVNYKDSSWITLLENRIQIAKDLINKKGSMFVRCDYNGNMYVRMLMNNIFGEENFRNELIINRTLAKQQVEKQFVQRTDSLFFYSKTENLMLEKIERDRPPEWHSLLHFPRANETPRKILEKDFYPPKNRRWALSQERINKFEKAGKIRINKELSYTNCKGEKIQGIPELLYDSEIVGSEWLDIASYAQGQHFATENSEILLKRVVESTPNKNNLVMDFFLGSGTTTAVAHKLGRKWIGVEMGEHFNSVVLSRMKKVLSGDKSGISKEKDVNWKGGGFFKYYDLEQYEQTLRRTKYKDSHPFENLDDKSIFQQYVFFKDLKLLDSIKLNYEKNKVDVDFSKLYDNVDIAETLSCITGENITKVGKDFVVLDKTGKIDYKDIPFKMIKRLVVW
jgi:adenine specific DNA methylase Mod